MNISEKIVHKINSDNIKPTSKWAFIYNEWMRWILYFLFIMMGSISFSIILFAISVNGFDLLEHFKHSTLESILVLLPILWLGTMIFFLGASIMSVLSTGRAYKFTFGKWLSFSTGISLAIGTLFFLTGGAKWFENKFETNIESYESLLEKKTTIWSQPNLGTLSGEVVSMESDYIVVKDWKGKTWQVDIKDSFIAPSTELAAGVLIKLNGILQPDSQFVADKIRPWGGSPGKCAK